MPSSPFAALQDPFALLLSLLPALLSRPDSSAVEGGLTCSSHRQPAAVLRALLSLLHPVAAGQAVALATGSSHPVAQAATAAASSAPLASALEGAAASQLLPWLQRVCLLSALLSNAAPPPAPDVSSGSAGPAAASLAASLGLPLLQVALQSPAAGALAPPAGTPVWQLPSTMQLSLHAAQRQWEVAVPPLPPAPKLMQLPASYQVRASGVCWGLYCHQLICLWPMKHHGSLFQFLPLITSLLQGWYLSLGNRPCSACGSAPSEPALCLRCGAVVCCNGRRCMGPARQVRARRCSWGVVMWLWQPVAACSAGPDTHALMCMFALHLQGMCYTHSLVCGGGTCSFFLVKNTRLLVIRKNRCGAVLWVEGSVRWRRLCCRLGSVAALRPEMAGHVGGG